MLLSNATVCRWLQVFLLLLAFVLLVSGLPEERRLSVYSNAASYSLAVQPRNGVDYVGLLEALEPLGTVSAKTSGHHWKLRFNGVEGEFTDGKRQAKVGGTDFDLTASFVLEKGRGLAPLSCLTVLFPRFLGGPVTFHEAARRLFVGDAAVHFTAQISKTNPPTLVMNFTSPVNPTIATEPGRLSLKFTRDGLVGPGTPTITFGSKVIPAATFAENNGAAEVVISGALPLMASFSNNNRTITVAAPPVAAAVVAEHPAPIPTMVAPTEASAPPPLSSPTEAHYYFAVIDPAHGGSENGAALGDQLFEKDITLAVARRLREQLGARRLTSLLVRDGDVSLPVEQRASLANIIHPAIYVCIHASLQGTGVRVFTSLVLHPSSDQGPFVDWESAQGGSLASSQKVVVRLGAALQTLQVPVHSLTAPVRPLNNIRTAVVGIEIAPPDGSTGPESPAYQESVARMLAIGLAAMHDELEAGR
jgi:N-acetylmuramoyl-L-alanine amidase